MWMLQRFKDETIQDQMPKKEDNIVFCKLASEQQEVYERILESPDYQMIRSADDPCHCGSGELTKHCHNHNPEGILFRCRLPQPHSQPQSQPQPQPQLEPEPEPEPESKPEPCP